MVFQFGLFEYLPFRLYETNSIQTAPILRPKTSSFTYSVGSNDNPSNTQLNTDSTTRENSSFPPPFPLWGHNLAFYFEGESGQRGNTLACYTRAVGWQLLGSRLRRAWALVPAKDNNAPGISCVRSQGCSSNYNSCAVIRVWWGKWTMAPNPASNPTHIRAPPQWIYLNC